MELEFYFPKTKSKHKCVPTTGKVYPSKGGTVRYGVQATMNGSKSLPKYIKEEEFNRLGFGAETYDAEIGYDGAKSYAKAIDSKFEGANDEGFFPADEEDFKDMVVEEIEEHIDFEDWQERNAESFEATSGSGQISHNPIDVVKQRPAIMRHDHAFTHYDWNTGNYDLTDEQEDELEERIREEISSEPNEGHMELEIEDVAEDDDGEFITANVDAYTNYGEGRFYGFDAESKINEVDPVDKMNEMVKNLSDVAYNEFCYRFDIDPEDAQEMSWFIGDHYDSPKVISWLEENHDKFNAETDKEYLREKERVAGLDKEERYELYDENKLECDECGAVNKTVGYVEEGYKLCQPCDREMMAKQGYDAEMASLSEIVFEDNVGKKYTTHSDYDHSLINDMVSDEDLVPMDAESKNCPVCKGEVHGDMSMIGEETVADICGDCDIYIMPQENDYPRVSCIKCGFGDPYGSATTCMNCDAIKNEMEFINMGAETVGNPSPSSPLEEVPATVPSPAEPTNENFEAESKNTKMVLGITALGIGLAFWKGKDLLSLWDRIKEKME